MKDLAIYGAGGLGLEVYYLISLINKNNPTWNFIGFFDDGLSKGDSNDCGTILGGIDDLNSWDQPLCVAFAIGSPRTIKAITSKVTNPLIEYPNIIAPDCISFGPIENKMGVGNIICLKCVLSCNVILGNFNILNGYISVGHDTTLGSYNAVMPGSRISGDITIGNSNLFGANSFIYQGLTIGDGIDLAPCSSLYRKPKNGHTYIGNPATMIKL